MHLFLSISVCKEGVFFVVVDGNKTDISESQTDINENKVDDINSENKMDVTRDENYDDRTPPKTVIVLD